VFPIMPGLVRTAMSEEAREHLPFVQKLFDEGREGTPETVARLVLTLASDAADALSGHVFSVSDDLEEIVRRAEQVQVNKLYLLRVRSA
jgi:NAD(P)-dependent dehydrogenase (short-subunit alcohol dehydrogenase family)